MAGSNKSISVSEAAALCGVGRTTVGYWIRSKKLHAMRVGRNYSIPIDDLLFFLKSFFNRDNHRYGTTVPLSSFFRIIGGGGLAFTISHGRKPLR